MASLAASYFSQCFAVGRDGRVDEHRHLHRAGNQLAQQFQPLCPQLSRKKLIPFRLPPGRARLATRPDLDWVFADGEDDGDCRRCGLGRKTQESFRRSRVRRAAAEPDRSASPGSRSRTFRPPVETGNLLSPSTFTPSNARRRCKATSSRRRRHIMELADQRPRIEPDLRHAPEPSPSSRDGPPPATAEQGDELPPVVAVGTCVSWHAPRPDPYVRLSRIRLVWGFPCQGCITPLFVVLLLHSFVRPAPRAFFRPDRILPSPSRAAMVKDGAFSAPPKACP